MFWNWLRNQAKHAVLAGVADAAAELDGAEPLDTANALTTLRGRILALGNGPHVEEPSPEATAKKKGKLASA